jgi:glucokinase
MTLVGDIGGTNTTLALASYRNGRFAVEHRKRYASQALSGIQEALADFLEDVGEIRSAIELCCMSGAGPVRNNRCDMTNVPWVIDGEEVSRFLGLRTFVINDFSAICYALPLIDTHSEISAAALPHTDGSTPSPHGQVRAVVGAGTGLGTGYLIEDRGHYTAHPSEAGHSDFAPRDEEMLLLERYLDDQFPVRPGAEQYISGQGIRNIYRAFRAAGRLPADETTRRMDGLPEAELPGAVADAAQQHEGLAAVMRLFVRMYARYASNTALFFLPTGGLYLAGGIAAKNEYWFRREDLFMRTFEANYNKRVRPLLLSTPVFLIKDYAVSLYGAAHAAVSLA